MHLTRIPGQRHREVRREAGRRADADDPAECGRDAHRAAEIRSLRDRQHSARNGCRGAAGGSCGAQGRIPRIARCPEHRIDGVSASRKFGRVGLGEHDRAGGLQPPDDLGILGRDIIGIKRAAVSRADIRGRNDVLDADRQAVQRPQFVAAHHRLFRRARIGPRAIGDKCHDRVQRRIEALDDREVGIEHLDRAERALAHERRELMGGFAPEIVHMNAIRRHRRWR